MPTEETDDEPYLETSTSALKLVSDYCGMDFNEVLLLDCYTYKVLFRDAFVYKLQQTEEGKDYLQKCWILRQTKPDRKTLREQFS